MDIEMLIIDPQNDFCDPKGALCVPGAAADMERLAAFINAAGSKITDIHVTLDSHHTIDVAHPAFTVDSAGKHPDPFTIIDLDSTLSGKYRAYLPSLQKRFEAYVRSLHDNNRYPLCVWPPHCLIGSWGHNVYPTLFDALKAWETQNFMTVDYVTKGSNPFTEHYSAVKADVIDPADPSTSINTKLIEVLKKADIVLVAGEAGSHCLANTVRDIAEEFQEPALIAKLHLLIDGTSPVGSFEHLQDDFIKEMTAKGMKVTTTAEFLQTIK